jgi:putative metalloprotease
VIASRFRAIRRLFPRWRIGAHLQSRALEWAGRQGIASAAPFFIRLSLFSIVFVFCFFLFCFAVEGFAFMDRRSLILALPAALMAGGAHALDMGGMFNAAKGATQALTLTDDQVRAYAAQMSAHEDAQNTVAPADSKYTVRLKALTAQAMEDQGLPLNYKVYVKPEVNAFAMADGSIRLYTGLMDMMTDDELRYVIAHEMGHVNAGHTRKRMQVAMSANAARDAAGSSDNKKVAVLAGSNLGDLFTKVVIAQHSQGNENEADDYAMKFLSSRKYDRAAAVTALEKLDKMSSGSGGSSWLSTHPAPRERASRMRSQIG